MTPPEERVVLHLVRPTSSADIVQALEELLRDARRGQLVGLAWVAMHPGYEYSVDIAGETRRCPTFTRGLLLKLDDELAKLV